MRSRFKHVEVEQNAYNGEELTANGFKNENIIQRMSGVMDMRGGEEEGTEDDQNPSPSFPWYFY